MISLRAAGVALVGLVGWTGSCLAAGRPSAPSLNPMATYPKAELKSFVDAPLFDPARRLPPPTVVAAPLPPAPVLAVQPPALELVGVIQGERAEAIIQDGGRTHVVRTGDHLGDWFVEVLPTTLRLHSGLRAFDYDMFREGGQAGPVPVNTGAIVASQRSSLAPSGSAARAGE